ncbi:MAG: bifunctional isocitrate dehydrogenase kinase/phosphatase [Chloroflexi bacterium 54-19]|nr:bifunctional isocitrate dehydrogenase kinase/phosphatase [Candidatus Melainabacteria bacterium]OJV92919.1 MAG: bifunctional isocitrate dehydrogenase kinase/phosphatase [Chloroflexi bacterium 54-19]
MIKPLSISRLANLGANTIYNAFLEYRFQFNSITSRAKNRFANRDWQSGQSDAVERLELYKKVIDQLVTSTQPLLEERLHEKLVWASIKAVYSGLISQCEDWEIAETFFNSLTRRIFVTVGLDPQIEFVDTDFDTPPTHPKFNLYKVLSCEGSLPDLVLSILSEYDFGCEFENLRRDVGAIYSEIARYMTQLQSSKLEDISDKIERAEMLKSVFYRGKSAYLIGRLFTSSEKLIPFAIALLNPVKGMVVDAVLLEEDEINILFSFTRSYFQVQVIRPYDMVTFLKSIMPQKRTAELYNSIGFNKHGKTELYRNLLEHLANSCDNFEIARGIPGMVMTVFTLPSYDIVFKIIKDQFDYPKTNTHKEVMEKYDLVFKHDRAGRLIDAHEFEHLKFERARFSAGLLAELQRIASQNVRTQGNFVIIKHAYIERRVTPLNLFIREASESDVLAAVLDCGNAVKDLAATNIFTGDMLLKNFGVTRHGRVVFYDYDELSHVTDCNFREFPEPETIDQELAAEPWFRVDENDIFPAEFKSFLGLNGKYRDYFVKNHADLFKVEYWWQLQNRLRKSEILDIFPYKESKRLSKEPQ